jgi:hypothetical protein
MLAEPLQPMYSQRFFAGRPSGAAAVEGLRLAGPKPGTSGGPGEEDPAGADSLRKTAGGVAQTVALAQRLVGARQAGKPVRGRGGVPVKKPKPWVSERRRVCIFLLFFYTCNYNA